MATGKTTKQGGNGASRTDAHETSVLRAGVEKVTPDGRIIFKRHPFGTGRMRREPRQSTDS